MHSYHAQNTAVNRLHRGFVSETDKFNREVVARGAPTVTILVISLSSAQGNLEADWAEACADIILRRYPICEQDSIVGHGRRRKQAHDAHHDWIGIRRGLCSLCGKTFTFLPPFSPPYGNYSLIARSQALRGHFVEDCVGKPRRPRSKILIA